MVSDIKENVMRKNYVPNQNFKGKKDAFERLDRAIENATKRDSDLGFEYSQETLNLELAGILHKLRIESGLTQEEVAKLAGLNQPLVSRIENPASAKKPSLETLAKIAVAFNKQLRIEFV